MIMEGPIPFPLEFEDLILWLAITALILLITSGLISLYHGKTNLPINGKKLRNVALVTSILFLIMVAIRIISIIFH